jgi:hypothetical protein
MRREQKSEAEITIIYIDIFLIREDILLLKYNLLPSGKKSNLFLLARKAKKRKMLFVVYFYLFCICKLKTRFMSIRPFVSLYNINYFFIDTTENKYIYLY